MLDRAELYWLTTVRPDGRPHVTPLIGVALDAAAHFCTGLREHKARISSVSPEGEFTVQLENELTVAEPGELAFAPRGVYALRVREAAGF